MFKQRKCCDNPVYETVSSFYTYKSEPVNNYAYYFNTNVTTNITIPNSFIDKIVKASKNVISAQEVKEIIKNEMRSIIIDLDKEKKSYVEIQKCKHCGYIKKVEVKI